MKIGIVRKHWWRLILFIVGSLIFSIFSVIGLQIERGAVNYFYQELGDKNISSHFFFLKFSLLFIAGYMLDIPINFLLSPLLSYSNTKWTLDSNNDTRAMIFNKISKLSPKKLRNNLSNNEAISIVWNDSNMYVNKIIEIPTTLTTTTINIFSNFFFLFYNGGLYALTILLLLPLSQVFTLITYRINRRYRISTREKRKDFRGSVKDALDNFYCLFAFKKEELFVRKINPLFSKMNNKYKKWDFVSVNLEGIERTIVTTFTNLIRIFILLSLVYNAVKGDISFGDFVTFPFVISRLYWGFKRYSSCYTSWQDAKLYKERIEKIPESDLKGKRENIVKPLKIVIKNLSFYYGNNPVLMNINLTFETGKKYAIIGKSGCGKTTLARLLFAFHREYEGSIKINNFEYRELHQETIWEQVSHSDSNNFIFLASLKENINLLGEEEIEEKVFKKASLEKEELQEIDTNNHHALLRASDGQKQRVSLARNFFRNKPIVILDEALANLDKSNVERIKEEMKKEKEKIHIIISHNIDLKDDFYDEIIDLEKINKI